MKKWCLFLVFCGCIFSSCIIDGDFTGDIESISGTVIDITISGSGYWNGLDGARIKLTNLKSGRTHSATVDSYGEYKFYILPSGNYLIEGSLAGYSFVPQYITVAYDDAALPAMMAFPYDANDIYVIVNWTNRNFDINAYMVRDETNDGNHANGDKVAGVGYTDPNGKISYLYNAQPNNYGKPLVETIKITGKTGSNYEELRYYLHLNTPLGDSLTGSSTGNPAGATVYVMQGYSIYGTFPLAHGTDERVLSVVTFMRTSIGDDWRAGSSGGGWINGDTSEINQIRSLRNSEFVTIKQKE
ncbi:carboxypeptidase-like regulatory domain-containing protein [Brucepastera parasyntrophica]|uniref:carboxypeptidase-like regulatory domain-containing protein n=1 Tax=Brucepastera parasyntrophica TaxID=2880008 RepID=UPI00210A571D|nr:carboxypeptidase-like regulatory domain-containing protein [Brucepastera parasyntrophica]ULQ60293.1 carboxypeptidase-like regulatory domain-containing protein [Brucepastera parasyntrophica]